MANILHYFPNSDLRSSHRGLTLLAAKHKVRVETLASGSFVLFINRKRSQFKILTSSHIIAHYKSPHGSIDMGVLNYLPHAFSSEGFDFSKALRVKLAKDLAKRGIRT